MKLLVALFSALLIISTSSCNKTGVAKNPVTTTVDLNECIQRGSANSSATLCFEEVIGDSRCPAEAVCVWAGTAIAKFRLTTNGQEHILNLATMAWHVYPKSIEVDGYRVELVDVKPYPGTIPFPVPIHDVKAEVIFTKL